MSSTQSTQLDALHLAKELVSSASVTDASNEPVSRLMQARLESIGFETHLLTYTDLNSTEKIAIEARRLPLVQSRRRGIGYFCHNDVVSVEGWNCSHGGPFEAAVTDDKLWGRGACDMKGSAACALAALSTIDREQQQAPFYFFVTGDEECGMAGADQLAQNSKFFAEMVESQSYGIIGEPTELQVVNAHKGGCHVSVSAEGVAAHSSTADGVNANWTLIPFLQFMRELCERCESEQELLNAAFNPPHVSLNLVIENKPCSSNITVGESNCTVFFRPMPDMPWETIRSEIMDTATNMGLRVDAFRPLRPLSTGKESEFLQATLQMLQQESPGAVCYATDGCCFQALKHLLVIGPGSIEQAHRPNEFISLEQLRRGEDIFRRMFVAFGCNA